MRFNAISKPLPVLTSLYTKYSLPTHSFPGVIGSGAHIYPSITTDSPSNGQWWRVDGATTVPRFSGNIEGGRHPVGNALPFHSVLEWVGVNHTSKGDSSSIGYTITGLWNIYTRNSCQKEEKVYTYVSSTGQIARDYVYAYRVRKIICTGN